MCDDAPDSLAGSPAVPGGAPSPRSETARKRAQKQRKKAAARAAQQEPQNAPDRSTETTEPDAEDALVEAMIKEMPTVEVAPDALREQGIQEELARRREQQGKDGQARLRGKSDAIFARFDADGDGYLSYKELAALGAATGGELPEIAFGAICKECGADPKRGVDRDALFCLYTDAGMGDVSRDYNLVFAKQRAGK